MDVNDFQPWSSESARNRPHAIVTWLGNRLMIETIAGQEKREALANALPNNFKPRSAGRRVGSISRPDTKANYFWC